MKLRRDGIPKELKWRVLDRDGYTCRYCGVRGVPMEIDHVFPESKGGPTVLDNLVTACEPCNRGKRDRLGIYPLPIDYLDKLNQANEIIAWYEEYQKGIALEKAQQDAAEYEARMMKRLEAIQRIHRWKMRVFFLIRHIPHFGIGMILIGALMMFGQIAAAFPGREVPTIGWEPFALMFLSLPLIWVYRWLLTWYSNWRPSVQFIEDKE